MFLVIKVLFRRAIFVLTSYFQYILLGQNKIKEFNLLNLVQSSVNVTFIFFLLLVLEGGIFSTILAWAGATIIAFIFSVVLVNGATKIRWSFDPRLFKDSVKFGIKGYLGNAIQFLNYRLDMFLVAFFMNANFVGYYSVSVALAEVLWYFPNAIGTVVFARTPGLSTEEVNKSTPMICRNTLFITLIASLFLLALGRHVIILLFGSTFLPAVQPLLILLQG